VIQVNLADIDAIWVISDRTADDVYIPTIQLGEDLAIPLPGAKATAYATTVLTAVAYAEYDAAVFAQMRLGVGVPEDLVATVLQGLREDRPPLDDATTAPLRFDPLISSRDKTAAVHVSLNGERFCQWTAADARGHAVHVLDVATGVPLDAAYLTHLRGLNIAAERARSLVDDLRNWRVEV
jgi:hypothetical protein